MADDDGNLKRGSGAADAPPKKGGKGVKAWVADHKGATVGIIGIIVTLILYERSKSSSSTAAPAAAPWAPEYCGAFRSATAAPAAAPWAPDTCGCLFVVAA